MLSAAKHLVLRPFAEFILSEAEGLRVTHKCANPVWFDLGQCSIFLDARLRGHDENLFLKIKLTDY
jgi:hypothetical protein